MKLSIIILLSLFGLFRHNLFGQQPVYIEAGEIGSGVLKSRSGECFVITPGHVVEKSNPSFQIRGSRSVLSKGELLEVYERDLAIVRITEGEKQDCVEWNIISDYNNILNSSTEGFLEIVQANGEIWQMNVLLLEKDHTYITVRLNQTNEQISKGMSGSSLFTRIDGKKVYLGMLMAINGTATGIVIRANVIEKVLSDFFNDPSINKTEVAVISIKENTIEGFELAQKASDILVKQYPNYLFVPYEKGQSPVCKIICEISEFTENDLDNRIDKQIHKYKTRVVLTVKNNGLLVSRETLDNGATDYLKENAQSLSITRTLELTQKLKFEKR